MVTASQEVSANGLTAPTPEPGAAPRPRRLLPALVLLSAISIVAIGITSGELHLNGDEMRHGMSGVFFRDLMVDRPWQHPLHYAYEYYAKYPALGVPHWPPFFYFVEGLFFLVFGISAWVSRLTVLCFAAAGAYFWYRIARREGPEYRALFAAFIFPLLPYVLLYERATMLEIPLLALSLGALHFWRNFLEHERRRDIFLVGAFVAMALLTSQKAIFLPPFLVLHFLMERRWRLLARWDVWVAAVLSVIVVMPWYYLSFGTVALTYERAMGQDMSHVSRWIHWWYYPHTMRYQVGILLMALAGGGLVWTLLKAARRHRFLLLWVAVTYFTYSLIQEKDLRHTMVWIPPLVYFATLGVEAVFAKRRWALVGLCVVAAYSLYKAVNYDRPRVSGVEEAAQYVLAQPESDVIYYHGSLNGNFIFHVRKHDPEKRRLIAREKQLVATKIVQAFGTRPVITSSEEVLAMFREWGIRWAVVENVDFIRGMGVIRPVLNTENFELVRTIHLESNQTNLAQRKLLIYRYNGPIRRTGGSVIIPMMTLRDDIRIDLAEVAGQPWPN